MGTRRPESNIWRKHETFPSAGNSKPARFFATGQVFALCARQGAWCASTNKSVMVADLPVQDATLLTRVKRAFQYFDRQYRLS